MRKAKFATTFLIFSGLSTILFGIACGLHIAFCAPWSLTFFLTAATFFYHFVMRLFVGYVLEKVWFGRLCAESRWFREKPFERKLYAWLRLRKWKGRLPTYQPEKFDFQKVGIEGLIENGLQAEAVHETIAALSFLPVLLYFVTFDWVDLLVYLATGLAAACIDLLFACLQRYNRFRLLRVLHRIDKGKSV